jgi:hypothetical protein
MPSNDNHHNPIDDNHRSGATLNDAHDPAAPRDFQLVRDAWGRLVLTDADGVEHVGVGPVRVFPITDPRHWVSLVSKAGGELALIEDPAGLPAPVLELIEEELRGREFIPVILRIVHIAADANPAEWEVETDRGPTRFLMDSEDDVRQLGPYRALVVDVHGIRYLIADTRKLDAHSRQCLDRYL